LPASLEEVLSVLARCGLLLKQDKRLPSVVTLLAGEPLATSWWSHADSHRMFRILCELADHADVLVTKLLLGKDTLVHRTLWPAFLAVAAAGEPWQLHGLSPAGRKLLGKVTQAAQPLACAGQPVKELVSRLLVHATEVHTATGAHELALIPWKAWAARQGVEPLRSLTSARAALETATRSLGAPLAALPWHAKARSHAPSRPSSS
jgi:hypothetical protein